MVGMGKIAGIVLIVLGILGFLVAALWGVLNVSSGDLQATGLVFCLGPALLVLALMVGVGIFLILRGRGEEKEFAEAEKEKQVLNMVLTRGKLTIADAAIEMDLSRDQIKTYVYDLVGKGLFTGYIKWDEGVLYAKEASEMQSTKCPNCGGVREYVGKGIVRCPYCGAELFLP
jgi:hypothetical protein